MAIIRHLLIHGRVQGVGFRAFVKYEAEKLGLSGFVRNRKDGTVEAVALGDEAKVQLLIKACHAGPPASHVEKVVVSEHEWSGEEGFRHLPTL